MLPPPTKSSVPEIVPLHAVQVAGEAVAGEAVAGEVGARNGSWYKSVWKILRKYGLGLPTLALAVLFPLALLGLDTSIGHRMLADWLETQHTSRGIYVGVGRIDGSIYGKAQAYDVTLRDPHGIFLRVPVVDLDWRPFAWVGFNLWNGDLQTDGLGHPRLDARLDIRRLVFHRGVLLRLPQLLPDDGTPVLPNIDIRIDQMAIDHLTIAQGIAGPARLIEARGRIDIHHQRAFVSLASRLGGADRLSGLIDADEAGGRFALAFDYAAPKNGLLATVSGAHESRIARINGHGDWKDWRGTMIAASDGAPVAAFSLVAHRGNFLLAGRLRPDHLFSPTLAKSLGTNLTLTGNVHIDHGQLNVQLLGETPNLHSHTQGTADLHTGLVHLIDDTDTHGSLPLRKDISLDQAHAHITLDGPLMAPDTKMIFHAGYITVGAGSQDKLLIMQAQARLQAHHSKQGWAIPLAISAERAETGNAALDRYLTNIKGTSALHINGPALSSENLMLSTPSLAARGALRGDWRRGRYALSGQIVGHNLGIDGLAHGDTHMTMTLAWSSNKNWKLGGQIAGALTQIDNGALAGLVGERPVFAAQATAGSGQRALITHALFNASRLSLALSGQRAADGNAMLSGSGHQDRLGAFTLATKLAADGVHGEALFTDPLPSANVRNLHVAFNPAVQSYIFTTSGQSSLGAIAGTLALVPGRSAKIAALSGEGGAATQLDVRQITVSDTHISGILTLGNGGAKGNLTIAGGGVSGVVHLAPASPGQMIDAKLTARFAHFGSITPLTVSDGNFRIAGMILKDHTSLAAQGSAEGVGRGSMFIGRAKGNLALVDGSGSFHTSLAGRRGSRFTLDVSGKIAPAHVALAAQGLFAGEAIFMPHQANFSRTPDQAGGGNNWRLTPTEIDFGHGRTLASGVIGNDGSDIHLAMKDMPLSLSGVVFADLGLGGDATGLLTYTQHREDLPKGQIRLMIRGLTRSGLVVSSRPIELALASDLSASALQMRAVAISGRQSLGRLAVQITGLPTSGSLTDRLRAGNLAATMRYAGPVDAPWRLMALDAFDLTGPVNIVADIAGSIDIPAINGSLTSDNLHLQSALTGTNISAISVRGSFAESRLTLSRFTGTTAAGGKVTGSGAIDFTGITDGHGPGIDLRLAASKAQILARSDMALTASGPMRIMLNATGGTIAGRLRIDSALWRLGQAPTIAALPNFAVHEINLRADIAPTARNQPWRFLVDAFAPNKIHVVGLGLDSEWNANIKLRGTVDAPAIIGQANLNGGSYEFSGQHFDLVRGHILFDDKAPPNPRLDIAAVNISNGFTVNATVRGSSLNPQIAFSSVPALPEEDLLSRMLFGATVTGISAPEAVQLGAALAALHGGGGLDPINALRSAIGLDRLRIVNADPTIPHDTAFAVGKNVGRRFYIELMTDGHQYTATNLEYRITRWLSLLASVSTINRNNINARISHDY